MKLRLLVTLTGLMILPTLGVIAQESGEDAVKDSGPGPAIPRIGVVDMAKVSTDSKAVIEVLENSSAPLNEFNKKLEASTKKLNEAVASYEELKGVTIEEENQRRVSEIGRLREEIEELGFYARRESDKIQQETVGPMRNAILQTARLVGQRSGYNIVFSSETLIYFDGTVDITAEVIEEIDSEYFTNKKIMEDAAAARAAESKVAPADQPAPAAPTGPADGASPPPAPESDQEAKSEAPEKK